MEKILEDKKNVIIVLLVVLIGIMSINTFSLATDGSGVNVYTRDELSEKIDILENNVTASKMFLNVNPIGSIYTSINPTNPGTIYGGTWVSFGSGKTLVGVNVEEEDFNIVEKTGGSLSNSHFHYSPWALTEGYEKILNIGNQYYSGEQYLFSNFNIHHYVHGIDMIYNYIPESPQNFLAPPTSSTDISTLQPYITVYMWKRIV